MSGRMWKIMEAEAEKTGVAKTEERERRKEARKERAKEERKEKKKWEW